MMDLLASIGIGVGLLVMAILLMALEVMSDDDESDRLTDETIREICSRPNQ